MSIFGRNFRRTLVLADLHCGSFFGLTPPDIVQITGNPLAILGAGTEHERRFCWKWFSQEIDQLKPIDDLIIAGDLLEGKAERQEGLEILTSNREEQILIGRRVVEYINPKSIVFVRGTIYHTGVGEDWEAVLVDILRAENKYKEVRFSTCEQLEINGVNFDIKHKVSRSSVPYGRVTPLAKEQLWNLLWAERKEYPKADILLRAHVHYFTFAGALGWLGMILPALQTPGTRFGSGEMSGTVDYGFVYFDIKNDSTSKDYKWEPKILCGEVAPWAKEAVTL